MCTARESRGDAPAVGCVVAPATAGMAARPPAELRVQDSLLPPTIGLWCAGDARDWRRLQATLPARG